MYVESIINDNPLDLAYSTVIDEFFDNPILSQGISGCLIISDISG